MLQFPFIWDKENCHVEAKILKNEISAPFELAVSQLKKLNKRPGRKFSIYRTIFQEM